MAALSESSLPGVWRASDLATADLCTLASGHGELDQQLPGGGWPHGSLTEILQAQAGLYEWRLLLPALRQAVKAGTLVLIGSPHLPNLPALSCQGIPPAGVLRVEARTPAERLWSAEQVLRCRDLAALLVWLPQARPEQLRRLQMASQSSNTAQTQPLAFVFRPIAAQMESSPAPLRLSLAGGARHGLEVQILKRRGPALDTPLQLQAALPAVVALRASQRGAVRAPPSAGPIEVVNHAVDRTRPIERHRSDVRQPAHA